GRESVRGVRGAYAWHEHHGRIDESAAAGDREQRARGRAHRFRSWSGRHLELREVGGDRIARGSVGVARARAGPPPHAAARDAAVPHPDRRLGCARLAALVRCECSRAVRPNCGLRNPSARGEAGHARRGGVLLPIMAKKPDKKPRIFTTSFASVYPLYVQKAEKKGRTREEVDTVITWL